ncbi:hypothetical protein [Pseudomonas peli]|uniref:hypothetical protein n=1 Tax=Pseudomonas peli TaxID=592361 RepID=UPI003D31968E
MNIKMLLSTSLLLLAGCQSDSARKTEPVTQAVEAGGTATIMVIAKDKAKLGESGFDFSDNDKVLLSQMKISRTVTFEVTSGSHTFAVSSWGSPAYTLQAELPPESETCIQITSNAANYFGKFIFPLMRNATPTHVAQVVPCA